MGTQVKFEHDDRGAYQVAPTYQPMADAKNMPEDHKYCIPCQWGARKDCGRVCYITGGLVFVVNAILAIVLGVTILGPYNISQTFKETNCTSVSSEYTKAMKTCTYHYSKGKTQINKYSCVVIFVNLTVNVDPELEVDHAGIPIDGAMVTGSGSVRSSHTKFYSDMFSLIDEEECSYVPRPCSAWGSSTFYNDHSQGKTFRCLYNPAEPWQVITYRREEGLNLHILLPLSIVAVISLLMMVMTYCQCGCELVWRNCPQY